MSNYQFAGSVTHPTDMMECARKSLEGFPDAFRDLMEQTGGQAPTPDELAKFCDGLRQAQIKT